MSEQARHSGLWSDEPNGVDLLAFSAVAETVIDAILDEALDSVAIGVSGAWGSGKTTVLRLVEGAEGPQPRARQADPHRVHRPVAVRPERRRGGDPSGRSSPRSRRSWPSRRARRLSARQWRRSSSSPNESVGQGPEGHGTHRPDPAAARSPR
ncbi:P-loop NTPase fold protein [Micromonospora carbonacea]|uniref:P-loop NTPase fold protein n=1 Tax=Micromonospora carbonacea TaxID=47853 RepID=UPI0037174367